jgi:hypothetical protein
MKAGRPADGPAGQAIGAIVTMREFARDCLRELRRGLGGLQRNPSSAPSSVAGASAVMRPPSPTQVLMAELYRGLTEAQRREVCFDWDHREPGRGLLRNYISNHWQVTGPCIRGRFFSERQQWLIEQIFRTLIDPAWHERYFAQLRDDTRGHPWGADQSIAFFGSPGGGPFQFLITGRHLTLRGEKGTDGRLAFGGPIFYGHAASGYHEKRGHPGNIFWYQAEEAGRLHDMLDDSQRDRAIVPDLPEEPAIGFRTDRPGLPANSLDQKQGEQLERVLAALLAPFAAASRAHVIECLAAQGGLANCNLIYYRAGRLNPPLWDNWRLEGPSFVWYFRGSPHVHGWVNVAKDPAVELNAHRDVSIFPHHDPLA